jgi:hypothetical protein
MLQKIARVIVVGLDENERHELDNKTRELLQVNDVSWQYESHRCDTPDQAFALAAELKNIDIIYIGREDDGSVSEQMAHVHSLFSGVATLEKQPVVSYPYGKSTPQRHKLPVAIIALWKERNKDAR